MTRVPIRASAAGRHDTDLRALSAEVLAQTDEIRQGGGKAAIERQHAKGRKTAASGSPRCWTRHRAARDWPLGRVPDV